MDIEKELSDAHSHINMVESQLATANDRLLELEQSKAVVEAASSERLAEITELQRRLEGNELKEDLVGELNGQIDSLEKQLTQLQEEVRKRGCGGEGERERLCICMFFSRLGSSTFTRTCNLCVSLCMHTNIYPCEAN